MYGNLDADGNVICSVCRSPSLYFVSDGKCKMRKLFEELNCKVFNPVSDSCMICSDFNKFILLEGKCIPANSDDLKQIKRKLCVYNTEID